MNESNRGTDQRRRASRREFLKASTAAALAGGAAACRERVAKGAHVGGGDLLRVGLIGCGGRGTGAARQALQADKNVKLTAMADAFEDRLQNSLKSLQEVEEVAPKLDVPPERQFTGFDAYQRVLESGVDVVILTCPPHFRPRHLKAAIEAGAHVFAEKPVAVDAPGVRQVLKSCEEAKQKGLSVVSGLCLRYCYAFRETVRRIHGGAIGEIHTLQANDYRGGSSSGKTREPDWTEMRWQMRNWYYYTWLSGDFNVEQHVHYLDICSWLMQNQYPVKAVGVGGRQVRTAPEHGNIYDHHSVVYEYANGAKLFSNTRHMGGCWRNMSAQAVGVRGRANLDETRKGRNITTDKKWVYEGEFNRFYQTEHDELFASIRKGTPINNGRYMALSTMLAIVGRMATYTGQQIEWDKAMDSQEDLTPERYAWDATPPVLPDEQGNYPIATPGVTKFV
jgi:predicted dehydrogenase